MEFLPSENGFAFPNSFENAPVVSVSLPIFGHVGVGNAAGGMCGGMVFAALDAYLDSNPWPTEFYQEKASPLPGSPLFKLLAQRLVESWDVPWGIMKFYAAQIASDRVLWNRNQIEWGNIRRRLAEGRPVTLGLIYGAESHNPADMAHHHQVLGCRFMDSDRRQLRIYDPNFPLDDTVTMTILDSGEVHHSINGMFRGVFETKYT